MERRGGYALTAAVAAAAVAATAATAQAPARPEALAITLSVSPAVQTADFDKTVTLSGEVSGGPVLADALDEDRFELELDAVALGYDRPVDIEPITPRRDGSFRRKLDVAVNTRITLRPPEGGAFRGRSNTVTTRWKPLPEVSNYVRGSKLVMEYRVSVPGGIPFSRGSLRIRRGTARRAVFYAGPKRAIPRLGSARLRSAYDGEVHARLAFPFRKLPPGGGRIYACLRGTAFLGTEPLDRRCGRKRTRRSMPAPED